MKTASRPPFRRLVHIDCAIRAARYPNASTLAEELEVSSRTIHRDLEFLRSSLSAPLEFCAERNGFYYRENDYSLPLVRLTEGEMLSLFVAEKVMEQYRGSHYAQELASAFAKI